jgi:hypothetical protein
MTNRYFRTQAAMEKHAEEKHCNLMTRKKWSCVFCGLLYLGRQMLQNHVRKNHKREAHFCPRVHCGNHFTSVAEVKAHVKEVHENALSDEKTACFICKRRFSSIR